jgi:hypothetical protein
VTPNVVAATAFVNAMKAKDLSQAPLAEDVFYESPLSGEPVQGRDRVIRFLGVYLPVINDLRIKRNIAEGDYVVSILEVETSFGLLSLVYVLCLEAGQIAEIQAFYDPRAFLERMGKS